MCVCILQLFYQTRARLLFRYINSSNQAHCSGLLRTQDLPLKIWIISRIDAQIFIREY